jgi:SAM-dependent methyltransferase
MAREVVGSNAKRFQIDLLSLDWHERWDVVFLLDVLEHIPEDVQVLQRVRDALRPGGLLFVTTPALRHFWTYNDDLVHHVRRYSRRQFRRVGSKSGLELICARYFMFLLSPLLLLSRLKAPELDRMTEKQLQEHLHWTHRVPAPPINQLLRFVFALETPLGAWLPFPWGTSILGIFRKGPSTREFAV